MMYNMKTNYAWGKNLPTPIRKYCIRAFVLHEGSKALVEP